MDDRCDLGFAANARCIETLRPGLGVGREPADRLGEIGTADDEPLGSAGEERSKSNSGLAGSPVESSIERPAIPVAVAAVTLAPTSAGAVAKPPSKSALTGIPTLPAIDRMCARASLSDT